MAASARSSSLTRNGSMLARAHPPARREKTSELLPSKKEIGPLVQPLGRLRHSAGVAVERVAKKTLTGRVRLACGDPPDVRLTRPADKPKSLSGTGILAF